MYGIFHWPKKYPALASLKGADVASFPTVDDWVARLPLSAKVSIKRGNRMHSEDSHVGKSENGELDGGSCSFPGWYPLYSGPEQWQIDSRQ